MGRVQAVVGLGGGLCRRLFEAAPVCRDGAVGWCGQSVGWVPGEGRTFCARASGGREKYRQSAVTPTRPSSVPSWTRAPPRRARASSGRVSSRAKGRRCRDSPQSRRTARRARVGAAKWLRYLPTSATVCSATALKYIFIVSRLRPHSGVRRTALLQAPTRARHVRASLGSVSRAPSKRTHRTDNHMRPSKRRCRMSQRLGESRRGK